ncbi:MAG: GIY-YIG nuclease family protein [Pirellulales bacterium]
MDYVIVALLSMMFGAFCAFLALEAKRKHIESLRRSQDEQAQQNDRALLSIIENRKSLDEQQEEFEREKIESMSRMQEEQAQQRDKMLLSILEKQKALDGQHKEFESAREQFNKRAVSYQELQDENAIIKRDLRSLDIHVRKLRLDGARNRESQTAVDKKVQDVGTAYLKDNVKWIGSSLTPNNFANAKQRLEKVIAQCRGMGLNVPASEEEQVIAELRKEYERVVRAAFEREEQARIRAQIREEQKLEREREREITHLETQREAIRAALEMALRDATDKHSAEIQELERRLSEAEVQTQRAISQAQLTKAGYVYVISNIGSFGDDVFKIGMTRRLEPLVRIKELGDASVPFPFDVHMMISSDDAPTLENELHRALHKSRLNKTNPRKEFFRADVEAILQLVHDHHGEVEYVADADALEYRLSLEMSDEDEEFIENVYGRVYADGSTGVADEE